MLTITNTFTGKKEELRPLSDRKILLYVCGITPYDHAHLGHARVYVLFDMLYRLLRFLGYTVIYCRNFTDIDDKLIDRSLKEYQTATHYSQIAQRFINSFHQDMHALNCLPPTYEPRVTEHIPDIIAFIQQLIIAGYAYASQGDVYFSLHRFPEYGKLSKQHLDQLHAGARVQPQENKHDPLDFVLWKKEPEGTFFKSPWGYGRPGWHIECSALIKKYLGDQIDIHGGGMDLIFPHHENEIAQSSSLTKKPLASLWIHNAFVRINQEKMSKSLGNFFTIADICQQYNPMVLRYYILQHQYRAPLDFTLDELDSVQKSYQKLCTFFAAISCTPMNTAQMQQSSIVQQMLAFLQDDLNTPGMFGVLFESLSSLRTNQQEACAVKQFIQTVLGLTLQPLPEKTVIMTPEIQALIDAREQARIAKNWKLADELRDKLTALGVPVHDKKV